PQRRPKARRADFDPRIRIEILGRRAEAGVGAGEESLELGQVRGRPRCLGRLGPGLGTGGIDRRCPGPVAGPVVSTRPAEPLFEDLAPGADGHLVAPSELEDVLGGDPRQRGDDQRGAAPRAFRSWHRRLPDTPSRLRTVAGFPARTVAAVGGRRRVGGYTTPTAGARRPPHGFAPQPRPWGDSNLERPSAFVNLRPEGRSIAASETSDRARRGRG